MINVTGYQREGVKGFTLCLNYQMNGKRRQETTGLIIRKGNDPITKRKNKETQEAFKELLFNKEKELRDGIIIPQAVKRQRIDFFKYFEEYMEIFPSKERRDTSTLKHLKIFWNKEQLAIPEVTENMLRKFKIYLEEKLSGETPYDYFKMLKKVLKQATKEKLFAVNPATDITLKKNSNKPKSILTTDEIESLKNAYCGNELVKRAFLFSCCTGVRFCDVKVLKWGDITVDNRLKIIQVKTKHPLDLLLIPEALDLIGVRESDGKLLFPVPTWSGTNKNIKKWVEKAGIEKKITYHCARHTFTTAVYEKTGDIYIASKVAGHKGISETLGYIHHSTSISDAAMLTLSKQVV